MQERTVTIIKQDGWDEYMAEHHGHTAFTNAIGYLSEWNMWANRFDSVRITCSLGRNGDQPEIGASYTRTEYDCGNGRKSATVTDGYFICAIFQPQQSASEDEQARLARFSFHS
jgi:hypothetical protein